MAFETRVTRALGIQYPIFQGGMAWASNVELVAAVSNAGGLGILGAGAMPPEELSVQIDRIRNLTDKPFGINLYYLNPTIEAQKEVILEKRPPVVTVGAGNPGRDIPRFKEAGITVIPVVASVDFGRLMERAGADMLIAEGYESGGHVGELTTMALVPQLVDKVNVPVIAAGGIADGRGLVAAFALGAEAVQMGTRFLAAEECHVHPNYKKSVLKARDISTVVTGHPSGVRVRVIKNQLSRKFQELVSRGATVEELETLGMGALRKAVLMGDVKMGSVMAGQIAGLVNEILPARKIIENIIAEAEEVILKLYNSYHREDGNG